MVKKHEAYTYNYEDFVHFVSFDLADAVLNEYTIYAELHKNATYLLANTVVQFVKVISNWMKDRFLVNLNLFLTSHLHQQVIATILVPT